MTQPTAATLLAYHAQGARIIEACLAKAAKADPLDAPMPLTGDDAALWHRAQVEAYRHALEMMGPVDPTTTEELLQSTNASVAKLLDKA